MAITLQNPIIIQPAVTTTEVVVLQPEDNLERKVVRSQVALSQDPLIIKWVQVWTDAEYDANFDWTQAQLEAQIAQILEA